MKYGIGSVVLALAATGCEITINTKGAASGDTGTTEPPITDSTAPVASGDSYGGHTGIADPDLDADGSPASLDCNDADATIFPGAVERCDGFDNDCDLGVDDVFAASIDATAYNTVDEAILVAVDATRIDICPGSHVVSTTVWDAGELRLRGVAGAEFTTLHTPPSSPLFRVTASSLVGLRGLTVAGDPDPASTSAALIVNDAATLELEESVVTGSAAGGIHLEFVGGATLTLLDSSITGNGIREDAYAGTPALPEVGGAIHAVGSCAITLTNSTVSANHAQRGGGIYAYGSFYPGTITLDNSQVTGNHAEISGGGLQLENADLYGVNASAITANDTLGHGGGLLVKRSEVDGVEVSGNTAVYGGGVAIDQESLFDVLPETTLVGVTISTNTATEGGGIWSEDEGILHMTTAVILNTATSTGGGLYLSDPGGNRGVTANGTNFGSAATYDDNLPDDVFAAGVVYPYDGAATFICYTQTGCE